MSNTGNRISSPWPDVDAIDTPDFEYIEAAPLTWMGKLNRPRYAIAIMHRVAYFVIGFVSALVLVLISAAVEW